MSRDEMGTLLCDFTDRVCRHRSPSRICNYLGELCVDFDKITVDGRVWDDFLFNNQSLKEVVREAVGIAQWAAAAKQGLQDSQGNQYDFYALIIPEKVVKEAQALLSRPEVQKIMKEP